MAEDAVMSEPFSPLNSLNRGKNRDFHEFRQRFLDLQSCKRCICGGLWSRERFLVLPEAGNFFMPIRELKSPIRELKWFIRELLFSARKEGKAKAKLTRSLRNAVLHQCGAVLKFTFCRLPGLRPSAMWMAVFLTAGPQDQCACTVL